VLLRWVTLFPLNLTCRGWAQMGRRPRPLTPEASARHRFGAELQRLRLARGLTQHALGRLIWHSPEIVAKVEKGERWPSWDLASRCDTVLGAWGGLAKLWPDVERERLACDRRRKTDSTRTGKRDGADTAGQDLGRC
jgi:DNA-binding XRE family transcriptional regulator